MSDQPAAKASTYTGQLNTETQTSLSRAGFNLTIPSNQAATVTGNLFLFVCYKTPNAACVAAVRWTKRW
jgi:hypothetical protein